MSFYTWTDDTKAEFERAVQSPTAAQRGLGHNSHKSSVNQQIQGGHRQTPACRAFIISPLPDKWREECHL